MSKTARIFVIVGLIAMSAAGAWVLLRSHPRAPTIVATTQPTTNPSPATTQPTTKASPPKNYMDVVLATRPDFPTTQPLGTPLDLSEAARLRFEDPIHLDQVLQLWITRDDADPTPAVLKRTGDQTTHVTRERVVFVHRWPDEKGVWQPLLVCRKPEGGYRLIRAAGRQELDGSHAYRWDRAFSWNDVIVAPTETGISIIRPDRRPIELHREFKVDKTTSRCSEPQVLLDWRGLIAWMPWDAGKTGSEGAIRFVNDRWIDLDVASGWPAKLLHLIPLLDGSIIQIVVNENKRTSLAMATLDRAEVDARQIDALVDQLSDPDPDKRDAAFLELTRYGTGLWPILEKVSADQSPEAKRRIEELLEAKVQPTLGGMKLIDGAVGVIARSRGGAAMLYAEAGVSISREDDEPTVVAPAWLLILPGRAIQLAPEGLVRDLIPGKSRVTIIGDEILVSDQAQGPRWWLANHFSRPLLNKAELEFEHIVGFDLRGRWLFRKAADASSPTLVIDPTLPDPTPRLPLWSYPVTDGKAGWTRENWPAIKRGGAWVLAEKGWRPLDEEKEKLITELPAPATTNASEVPILIDADGARYFDGRESLRIVRPGEAEVTWPLPPEAIGRGDVWLLRAGDDRLFLFNEPGRVLRIKPTPDGPEPFALEATFTRRIPSVDHPIRIWIDGAGRMNMIAEPDHLLMMFPAGHIPPGIAEMMPAAELKEAEED